MGKFKAIAKIATSLFVVKKEAALKSGRSIAQRDDIAVTIAAGPNGDQLALYHVNRSLLIANSHYFKRALNRKGDEHVDMVSIMAPDTQGVFPVLVRYMEDHQIVWEGPKLLYVCELALKLEMSELLYTCRYRLRHCDVSELINYLLFAQEELNNMELSRPIVNVLAYKLSWSGGSYRPFYYLPTGLMLLVLKSPDLEPLQIPDFSAMIETYLVARERKLKERVAPAIGKTLRYLCVHLDALRAAMQEQWRREPTDTFSPARQCKELLTEFQNSLDRFEKEALMPRRLSVDSNVPLPQQLQLKAGGGEPGGNRAKTESSRKDAADKDELRLPRGATRRRASFDLGGSPNHDQSLLTTCFETGSCQSIHSAADASPRSSMETIQKSESSVNSSASEDTSKSDSNFVLASNGGVGGSGRLLLSSERPRRSASRIDDDAKSSPRGGKSSSRRPSSRARARIIIHHQAGDDDDSSVDPAEETGKIALVAADNEDPPPADLNIPVIVVDADAT